MAIVRHRLTYRPSEREITLLEGLAERSGLSVTRVIGVAVREMAEREGVYTNGSHHNNGDRNGNGKYPLGRIEDDAQYTASGIRIPTDAAIAADQAEIAAWQASLTLEERTEQQENMALSLADGAAGRVVSLEVALARLGNAQGQYIP